MRSSPNSSGHGLSEATQSVALDGLVAEGIELTTVALELLALRLDHLGRRLRGEALVREHPLGAGDLLLEPRRSRPARRRLHAPGPDAWPRRCASRRASSSMRTPLRAEDRGRFLHAVERLRGRRRTTRPARARAQTIRRVFRSGRCDQISSVTCGITGWSSFEQPLERGQRRCARVLVAVVEPRLDRLRVPVAEVVEGEVVERRSSLRRTSNASISPSISARAASSRARIQRSSMSRGRASGFAVAHVREDQARHVPELVRELRALLDRARARSARPAVEDIFSRP